MMMDLARLFGSIDAETEIHLWLLFGVLLPFPDLFAAPFVLLLLLGLESLSPGSSIMVSVYSAYSSGLGALSLQSCSVAVSGLGVPLFSDSEPLNLVPTKKMPRLQIADHRHGRVPMSFEPQSLVSISNAHENFDHHGRHTPTKVADMLKSFQNMSRQCQLNQSPLRPLAILVTE
ncbi:hypothetical protein RHSIM_Rhsim01G0104200 [Rhododendron simsii]|uniref:Uncharacterized protein n=1 Tax=Rhododendron simsii TaxID=118357 RepID=A0A834HHA2_RHOSS|nr:hypothetical protein RHSIM_Rhsim01G0104200 [Rhododendron simsii]